MSLGEDVDLDELSKLCEGFTGADLKSVVCDAMIKAFHRAHKTLQGDEKVSQEKLKSLIRIESLDLKTSIEAIKQTINKNERFKLTMM